MTHDHQAPYHGLNFEEIVPSSGGNMSENVRSQKWLAISFFLVCNLIFFALIYAIISGSADRNYSEWMANTRSDTGTYSKDAGISKDDPIIMVKDQRVNLEKLQMTYRGASSGVLRLDLVLLELDPQFEYHRQIPIEEAEQGFQVSDRRFKVISINRQRLKMVRINPSQ